MVTVESETPFFKEAVDELFEAHSHSKTTVAHTEVTLHALRDVFMTILKQLDKITSADNNESLYDELQVLVLGTGIATQLIDQQLKSIKSEV